MCSIRSELRTIGARFKRVSRIIGLLNTISAGLPDNINGQSELSDETPVMQLREPPHNVVPERSSLEEERGEILASLRDVLAAHPPDPDEMAACSRLLKHLAQTAARPRSLCPL